jgi:CRP-like cAMP-binding protein
MREVHLGEVLVEQGDRPPFFVVVSGELEIVRPSSGGGGDAIDTLVTVHGPGDFTEVHMLSGRRTLIRIQGLPNKAT